MTEPNVRRRQALGIILVVFVLLALAAVAWWWLIARLRETTNDAYVAGDQVAVSAQVAGTVIRLNTDDTAQVDAGAELLALDGTDAEVALARAAANLAQSLRLARQQRASANQYDAQLESRRLEIVRAEQQLQRRLPLLAAQAVSAEEVREAESAVELARSALRSTQQQAAAARALVADTPPAEQPAVLEARAAYQQAWLAARRNRVLAPVSGQVARRSVQLGQRVQAGQALLVIVPLQAVWIDANFKEPQLRRLRVGQTVKATADVYGSSVEYHGVVAGVAAGTGSAFSLLPAQNASGNWVKVVQRVPVRIQLDAAEVVANPLRIGMSMSVAVDISVQDAAVLQKRVRPLPSAGTTLYDAELQAAALAADAVIAGKTPPSP